VSARRAEAALSAPAILRVCPIVTLNSGAVFFSIAANPRAFARVHPRLGTCISAGKLITKSVRSAFAPHAGPLHFPGSAPVGFAASWHTITITKSPIKKTAVNVYSSPQKRGLPGAGMVVIGKVNCQLTLPSLNNWVRSVHLNKSNGKAPGRNAKLMPRTKRDFFLPSKRSPPGFGC
jgi:hypothetical protein